MIENIASNLTMKKVKKVVVEQYFESLKVNDNDNHDFLEELLKVYGFPPCVQILIIEMMSRLRIKLAYGAEKDVGEVRLTNGIVQGDAFSPVLFVLRIDPLIKAMKTQLGDRVEILYCMEDRKALTENVETARAVHGIVKKYATAVGMVVNINKSTIQMDVGTPLPESLQEIPSGRDSL